MSDTATDAEPRSPRQGSRTLLERLTAFMRPNEPADREEIKAVLDAAHDRDILDGESWSMISGALDVANKTVADIMVPRSRMDMIDIDLPLAELLPDVLDTGRSRFPVFEGDRENIIGILLAKDLLQSITNPGLNLRTLVRPAVFVPESKRLNVLLHDFRSSRNHLAMVIDEHGGTSGLVTMEDVLEQIVGDIEDEFDEDEAKTIFQTGNNSWRAMGITTIENFNRQFAIELPEGDYDTIGGWLAAELGHIPQRGEHLIHEQLRLTVVGADAKRALWVHVQTLPANIEAKAHAHG